jgi:hypothetical protein
LFSERVKAAAYHGAGFRGIANSAIPSRRTLARLALAIDGYGTRESTVLELGVGWMLALLGVLAVGSWQGRAGMTAAVSYARLPAAAAAMRCSKASKAAARTRTRTRRLC